MQDATLAVLLAGITLTGLAMVTVGAQQQPTRIDSCTTITESGRYVLSSNLTGPANQTTAVQSDNGTVDGCVVVAADDVFLDGRGHHVRATNDTASDGGQLFTEDEPGAEAGEPDGNETLPDVNAISGSETPAESAGIVVASPNGTVSNVTITDVSTSGWFWGLAVVDADGVTVTDTTVSENTIGVETARVSAMGLRDVNATGNAISGYTFGRTSATTMVDSRATDSGTVGLHVTRSRNVTVVDLNVSNSGVIGIALSDTDASVIADPVITGTGVGSGPFTFEADVALFNASDNIVDDVRATGETRWSYYAEDGSTNNTAEVRYHNDTIEVSVTGSDVAFKRTSTANADFTGMPILLTNTAAGATADVSVTWRTATPATDGVAAPGTATPNQTTSTPAETGETTTAPPQTTETTIPEFVVPSPSGEQTETTTGANETEVPQ